MKKRDLRYAPALAEVTADVHEDEISTGRLSSQVRQQTETGTKTKHLFDLVAWIDQLSTQSTPCSTSTDYGALEEFKKNPVPAPLVEAFIKLTPSQINLLRDIKDRAHHDLSQLLPLSVGSKITFMLLPEPIKGLIWPYVAFNTYQESEQCHESFN